MSIPFDDGVAGLLRRELGELGRLVSARALSRGVHVDAVMGDFLGVYADLFWQASQVGYEDQMRLGRVLEDLGEQVEVNRRRAEDERERIRRRVERERAAAVSEQLFGLGSEGAPSWPTGSGSVGSSAGWGASFVNAVDEEPVRPVPLSVRFMARERTRNGGSGGSGRSSADPVLLREFVTQVQRIDAEVRDVLGRLRGVWAQFVSSCSWVPSGDVNLLPGFYTLVIENEQDVLWVGRIANAFEQAGGGSLLDVVVTASVVEGLTTSFRDLFRVGATMEDVARAWQALGWDEEKIQSLPLGMLYVLGNLDGLPAWVRNTASRSVLQAGLDDPKKVYDLMAVTGISLEEFTTDIQDLHNTLTDADEKAWRLSGDPNNRVAQLSQFSFGDGEILAAVNLGNLDAASNVTINVPGAGTTVGSMGNNLDAVEELLKSAQRLNPGESFAGVAWLGYKAPDMPGVISGDRAKAGGKRLAGFIDGMYTGRGKGNALGRVTVAGHSYGSTATAEGLKETKNRVDAFIAYGSAGIERGTTMENLNAERMYATQASKDGLALVGVGLTAKDRVFPWEIEGAEFFSSEAGPGTKGVTEHDMYPGGPGQVGYLSPDSTSLNTMAEIVAGRR